MSEAELAGARVAVLRAGGRDDDVAAELRARGATVVTVRVADVVDRPDDVVRADVGELARYHWVAVTSVNAARRLSLWSSAWPPSVRVAAVAATTALAARHVGIDAAATSPDGTAAGLAARIDDGPVLFLAARNARRELVDLLEEKGIEVDCVVAYKTVPRDLDDDEVTALAGADAVVAMSPSGLDAVCSADGGRAALVRARLVAIGPTTAAHATALGVVVGATARDRDAASVALAVRESLS